MSELRLRGVATRAAANAFLPRFLADFNQRFSRAAQQAQPVWRQPPRDLELVASRILGVSYKTMLNKITEYGLTGKNGRVVGAGTAAVVPAPPGGAGAGVDAKQPTAPTTCRRPSVAASPNTPIAMQHWRGISIDTKWPAAPASAGQG